MTDKTPANDPAPSPAASSSPASAAAQTSGASSHASPSRPVRARSGASPMMATLVVVILLALALVAALWLQRQQFLAAGREIASRLDALSGALAQTRAETRQALGLAQAQSDKIAALESTLRETQSQYTALQQAWQDFNDNVSDDVLLNDVERLLTIADQQLRLGGSVSNAIVAMETAQSRLARAARPRYASLQQTINGDLDRLRAVKTVDVPVQASRIERLVGLVGRAPLLTPDAVSMAHRDTGGDAPRAAVTPEPAAPQLPADAAWWQRWRAEIASWPAKAGSALTRELGDLVRVQRVDDPAALLLSPDQAEQLRAALRQRLLTVQSALLMRQPAIWKNELDTVVRTLDTYYDRRSPDTLAALGLARELAETQIAVAMPSVSDSLSAVAALRSEGANPAQGRD
ncbi:uroporphyrinogen-III C-methyltransferase [Bordetella genomosp. 9]|uniref:Heme biosynthesis operon protein HemX n=1 Tax=Bordetella genomosp. 9 TaxID=1416803 RepID=A0A1W6Z1E1_9BORD|nr:heme biosynthesis operon protein HemX [Bordetella genomosp. 9]